MFYTGCVCTSNLCVCSIFLGGIALVHCAMGINRSATICVAYLISHQKMTLLRAVQLVKDRRRLCLTNRGFQLQLISFAKRKRMLEPLPSMTSRKSCPDASAVPRPLHTFKEHQNDYRQFHPRRHADDDFFSKYIESRMKDISCTDFLCNSTRENTYQPSSYQPSSYQPSSTRVYQSSYQRKYY